MSSQSCAGVNSQSVSFDLIRLTKAKAAVDLSPNTIRAYARDGLSIYRKGRAVFFSRSELELHIRRTASKYISGAANLRMQRGGVSRVAQPSLMPTSGSAGGTTSKA